MASRLYLVPPGLEPLDTDLDAETGELLLVAVGHGNIAPIYAQIRVKKTYNRNSFLIR